MATELPTREVSWQAIQAYFPGTRPSRFIKPLPEFDLVYVKNPKAASSTVLLWLDRLYTGDHSCTTEYAHRDNRLPTGRSVGWDTVSEMLGGSAFRFTFVREPLSRFESTYYNKLARKGIWRPQVQAILGLPRDRNSPVTFEQFLSAVEQQDPLEMDLHWRPQHLNLMHPLVSYDLVGHVETFDRASPPSCARCRCPMSAWSLAMSRGASPETASTTAAPTWCGGCSGSTPPTSSSTATEPAPTPGPSAGPGRGSGRSPSRAGNARATAGPCSRPSARSHAVA